MTRLVAIIKSALNRYQLPILLVLVILLVLYPFSLFMYVPKWDNINGYLPYRYFISDYLWNGHLPLWNPFQRFGYPGYADLQSGCWYPLVWILMLFGKYDITSLMIELMSCYIIAGLGMYKLSCLIHQCKKTAFLLGLSYALSGYMMGSAQLMVFLVGVAWLPWCIWALLQFFNTKKYKYVVLASLFVAFHITSASPAFTIILAYIIFGMFLYQGLIIKFSSKQIKPIIFGGIVFASFLIILILPYIKSFLDFAPYFNRGERLDFSGFLLSNPFVLADYWSFLFPYTVISHSDWFKLTDLSMRNAYIGLFGLVAFLFALINRKQANGYYFPLVIGVVMALILSFGDKTPVFRLVYHLPGFGFFRHPSFFRIYAMFCMLLLSGFWIRQLFVDENRMKELKIASLSIFGIAVITVLFAYINSSSNEIKFNWNEFVESTEFHTTGFYSHLFINGIAVIMALIIVLILKILLKINIFNALVLFIVFDLGTQAILTAPSTLHYSIKYADFKTYFDSLPNEINQKYNTTPFKVLDDTQGLFSTQGIWQNVATYNKTISSVGTNPMRFKAFDDADDNGKLSLIKENTLFYFPTQVYQANDTIKPGYIWSTPSEVSIINGGTSVGNVSIDYNKFNAEVSNSANEEQWLVLNQNHHYLWKANYNGKELPIHQVNDMVMGVEIPKKSNGKVEFEYSSPILIYTFIISLFGYILVVVLLFRLRESSLRNTK